LGSFYSIFLSNIKPINKKTPLEAGFINILII
jgi:hypothetical protein